MAKDEKIIEIAIERLRDFPKQPFKVTKDKDLAELVKSIRDYGILTPLIVRPRPEGCYEIISGHRRKFAAVYLGYTRVPVIIRVMNDDQAIVNMVDSNLHLEHMIISEKAAAYKMKYDVVKREGKHPKEYYYGEKYRGLKTVEFMGREQNDSPKQVQRLLHINRLIPELLKMVDEGKFGFTPAAELALLPKEEQEMLKSAMEYTQSTPTLSQAYRIKRIFDVDGLTEDRLIDILSEGRKCMLRRIMLSTDTLYQYFPKDESPQDIKIEILRMLKDRAGKRSSVKQTGGETADRVNTDSQYRKTREKEEIAYV